MYVGCVGCRVRVTKGCADGGKKVAFEKARDARTQSREDRAEQTEPRRQDQDGKQGTIKVHICMLEGKGM